MQFMRYSYSFLTFKLICQKSLIYLTYTHCLRYIFVLIAISIVALCSYSSSSKSFFRTRSLDFFAFDIDELKDLFVSYSLSFRCACARLTFDIQLFSHSKKLFYRIRYYDLLYLDLLSRIFSISYFLFLSTSIIFFETIVFAFR